MKRRYSEPRRKHHTLQHPTDCAELFAATSHLAEHPFEVEAALWFRDAVYDVRANDDAERSAGPVLATKHRALPTLPDEKLLVGIELSILGARTTRFDESELQIRAECSLAPDALFKTGQGAVLRSLLERARLSSTERLHEQLGETARANLAQSSATCGSVRADDGAAWPSKRR